MPRALEGRVVRHVAVRANGLAGVMATTLVSIHEHMRRKCTRTTICKINVGQEQWLLVRHAAAWLSLDNVSQQLWLTLHVPACCINCRQPRQGSQGMCGDDCFCRHWSNITGQDAHAPAHNRHDQVVVQHMLRFLAAVLIICCAAMHPLLAAHGAVTKSTVSR